ncbi:MAG: hypothetical protein KGI71_04945 [Patescibacteria group bacterium]|nr:hypothetical protein [Patescibacteria group bacterium]
MSNLLSNSEVLAGLVFLQIHCDPEYRDAIKAAENVVLSIRKRRRIAELYEKSVDTLTLSIRVQHRLQALGIKTIGQLCDTMPGALLKRRAFGVLNLRQVRDELGKLGLTLSGEVAR